MPGADGEDVAPDVEVTQLGRLDIRGNAMWHRLNFSFRCGLRDDDEGHISLLEGRLAPEVAVPLVDVGNAAGAADAVRYSTAGALQSVGFRVAYKIVPTIPGHIGVYWDGQWDEEVSNQFNRCFTDCLRGPLNE